MWDKQTNKQNLMSGVLSLSSLFLEEREREPGNKFAWDGTLTLQWTPRVRKWSQMDKPHADFYSSLSHTSHREDHDFYQDSRTSSTVNIYALKQLEKGRIKIYANHSEGNTISSFQFRLLFPRICPFFHSFDAKKFPSPRSKRNRQLRRLSRGNTFFHYFEVMLCKQLGMRRIL